MDKDYLNPNWKKLRKEVIIRDNFTCCRCQKKFASKKLRVHHKTSNYGNQLWDVSIKDLETLCSGCLAEIHKKIIPQYGWDYLGAYDLEDLIGSCERCGTSIRYEHTIFHPNYGELTVGSKCAEELTNTSIAKEWDEKRNKYLSTLKRFIESPLWKLRTSKNGNIYYHRKYKGLELFIWGQNINYKIWIKFYYISSKGLRKEEIKKGKKTIASLYEAKKRIFDFISDGKLERLIKEQYGEPLTKK